MSTMTRVGAIVVLVASVAACSPGDETTDGLTVVATTTVLADVVGNVVGDGGTVVAVMPAGADPHDYRPSSQDAATLGTADLVVAIGLGLEEGLADVLESVAGDGVTVLEVGPLVDPIEFGAGGHGDDHDDEGDEDHEEGAEHSFDPHIWFDPLRVATAAGAVADALTEIDPTVDWSAAASSYADALGDADAEIGELLATVPSESRVLVTNHDSLGYLADRYGYEVVGTVVPGGSTLAEPSSADLAELVEVIRAEGVRAIFVDTSTPTALAEAVAAEVGEEVRIVPLFTGTLGDTGETDTLIEVLVENASRIAEALGGGR